MTLNSADPSVEPNVDFNMCSDERDLIRIVQATRMLARMHDHSAVRDAVHDVFPAAYSERVRKVGDFNGMNKFKTWVAANLMDLGGPVRRAFIDNVIRKGPTMRELLEDDEAIADWVRTTVTGHWHASCTCRMGAEDDSGAVTDPSARVYGVEGLRVVLVLRRRHNQRALSSETPPNGRVSNQAAGRRLTARPARPREARRGARAGPRM